MGFFLRGHEYHESHLRSRDTSFAPIMKKGMRHRFNDKWNDYPGYDEQTEENKAINKEFKTSVSDSIYKLKSDSLSDIFGRQHRKNYKAYLNLLRSRRKTQA